jgi:hypothetical protein
MEKIFPSFVSDSFVVIPGGNDGRSMGFQAFAQKNPDSHILALYHLPQQNLAFLVSVLSCCVKKKNKRRQVPEIFPTSLKRCG